MMTASRCYRIVAKWAPPFAVTTLVINLTLDWAYETPVATRFVIALWFVVAWTWLQASEA